MIVISKIMATMMTVVLQSPLSDTQPGALHTCPTRSNLNHGHRANPNAFRAVAKTTTIGTLTRVLASSGSSKPCNLSFKHVNLQLQTLHPKT